MPLAAKDAHGHAHDHDHPADGKHAHDATAAQHAVGEEHGVDEHDHFASSAKKDGTVPAASADQHDEPGHDDHGHDDHGEDGHGHGDHGDEDEGREFSVADFERSGVSVVTVGPGGIDGGVEFPGEVRPNADRIARIAPRFPGIVRDVRKRVGDRVARNETLAIVESENLAPFELKASLDGVVIEKRATPGEMMGREQAAFVIADPSTVWVIVQVPPGERGALKPGQTVRIAGAADGAAPGAVAYVAPVVDPPTRMMEARTELLNRDGAWLRASSSPRRCGTWHRRAWSCQALRCTRSKIVRRCSWRTASAACRVR